MIEEVRSILISFERIMSTFFMVQTPICIIVYPIEQKIMLFKKQKKKPHYVTLGSLKDPRIKLNGVHVNLLLTC
jgi:hypothetical protein